MDYLKLQRQYKQTQLLECSIKLADVEGEKFVDFAQKSLITTAKINDFYDFYKYQIDIRAQLVHDILNTLIREHGYRIQNNLENYILPGEIEDISLIKKLHYRYYRFKDFAIGVLLCEIIKEQRLQSGLQNTSVSVPEKIFDHNLTQYDKVLYKQIAKELSKVKDSTLDEILKRGQAIEDFIQSNRQYNSHIFLGESQQNKFKPYCSILTLYFYKTALKNIDAVKDEDLKLLAKHTHNLASFVRKVHDVRNEEPENLRNINVNLKSEIDNLADSLNYIEAIHTKNSLLDIFLLVDHVKNMVKKEVALKNSQDDRAILGEGDVDNSIGDGNLSFILADGLKKVLANPGNFTLSFNIKKCLTYAEYSRTEQSKSDIQSKRYANRLIFNHIRDFWQKSLITTMLRSWFTDDEKIINSVNIVFEESGIDKDQIQALDIKLDDDSNYCLSIRFLDIDDTVVDKYPTLTSLKELIKSKIDKKLNTLKEIDTVIEYGDKLTLTVYEYYCLKNLATCRKQYQEVESRIENIFSKEKREISEYIYEAQRILIECITLYLANSSDKDIEQNSLCTEYEKTINSIIECIYDNKPIEEIGNIAKDILGTAKIQNNKEDVNIEEPKRYRVKEKQTKLQESSKNQGSKVEDERQQVNVSNSTDNNLFKYVFTHRPTVYLLKALTITIILCSALFYILVGVIAGSTLLAVGAALCIVLITTAQYRKKGEKTGIDNHMRSSRTNQTETLNKRSVQPRGSTEPDFMPTISHEIAIPALVVNSHDEVVDNHADIHTKNIKSREREGVRKNNNSIYQNLYEKTTSL